ncbi:porin [Alkalilacustris brevis]|uniref:porin n=1 Tax=Alkalilacustris brevis TaxID=2026338 RepID=UPI000E0D1725|nr:porin [Alkalilacustris brevis]
MKKILIATTALALSAGMASAQGVTLSGNGWMGVDYSDTRTESKALFKSRLRVQFNMAGETDGGLSFGGSFRADQADDAAGNTMMDGGSVFIGGEFGTIEMGDVDSALEATWFRTRHIGVMENAGGSRASALGVGETTGALYTYSMDAFTFAVSSGQLKTEAGEVSAYSVGAQYSADGFGVGIGYEQADNDLAAPGTKLKHIMISGQASFDNISLRAFAGRLDDSTTKENQYGFDINASFDAVGVQFRAKRDFAGNNHVGAGVTYALGGGATIGASINDVQNGATTADVGVAFRF